MDSGLAVVGSGEAAPSGLHFETLVANDALVWSDEAPGRSVEHWRTASKQEVDFVLRQGQHLVAVEVKAAETVSWNEARHLATFLDRRGEAKMGVLLSSDEDIRFMRDRIIAAPWWAVL